MILADWVSRIDEIRGYYNTVYLGSTICTIQLICEYWYEEDDLLSLYKPARCHLYKRGTRRETKVNEWKWSQNHFNAHIQTYTRVNFIKHLGASVLSSMYYELLHKEAYHP